MRWHRKEDLDTQGHNVVGDHGCGSMGSTAAGEVATASQMWISSCSHSRLLEAHVETKKEGVRSSGRGEPTLVIAGFLSLLTLLVLSTSKLGPSPRLQWNLSGLAPVGDIFRS